MDNAKLHQVNQVKEFSNSVQLATELDIQCMGLKSRSISYTPLPLQRDSSSPKPYPFKALGSILGPAAQRIHEVVQAPDATCGQSVLAALSLACQAFIDVQIDGRIYPTSLYLLTVSERGERKSATDKIALKPIYEWQRMLIDKHKAQLTSYKNEQEIWKARRTFAIKEASDNKRDLLICLEIEPQPPCEGLILCEEPTLEGLEQLLERGQPSTGIFSDEGGRLVGGHALNADNALKTACGLSNLWDGRRLSVHLMIQPIVLMQLLNNAMLMGQGLLSRCLFSAPLYHFPQ